MKPVDESQALCVMRRSHRSKCSVETWRLPKIGVPALHHVFLLVNIFKESTIEKKLQQIHFFICVQEIFIIKRDTA